jgi:glycosyltransferase involved in cell wall biosynthesis
MKIAYVTTYDASDSRAWSGLGNYILKSLQESGFQTETIGNLRNQYRLRTLAKKAFHRLLFSKRFDGDWLPELLKDYAAQAENSLARIQHDVVFSPGTIPIAYLQSDKPVVFWTDATFAGITNFYQGSSNLCREAIRNGNKAEQQALSKCRLAIYSSDWAANSAMKFYDVDPAKIKVVPFGANITGERTLQQLETILASKNFDTCKLLFLGVDWLRKGGDTALKVADILNRRGIRTELHIAGCTPTGKKFPDYVKQHGFISKETPNGEKRFNQLMTDSHFLILPSRAECYGVVFAEASSFGLPSLATNVGGIPSAIHNGKNGRTFALNEEPEHYCDDIEKILSSKKTYNDLARSSFHEYSERLNWKVAGRKVHDLITEFCTLQKETQ